MQRFCFEHGFFPVGQGLCASGKLLLPHSTSRFSWVFDCGTTSGQVLVSRAIDRIAPNLTPRPFLDLFMISHFDKDHISGVTELIRRTRIGVLLLPYLTLAERLLVAFANGMDADDQAFGLFLDPVAFIKRIDGQDIEKIVLVLGGRRDPPPAEGGGGEGPEGGERWPIILDGEEEPGRSGEEIERWNRAFGNVSAMKPGGRVRVANAWEFVPYNDSQFAKDDAKCFSGVERERDVLLQSNDQTRQGTLKKLREAYDARFGKDAFHRNLISLFVYSAPLTSWKYQGYYQGETMFRRCGFACGSKYPSVLYTGDGYLDTKSRLDELAAAIGPSRLTQICVLQVMHHGAEGNWHPGVANRLDPAYSIFSSDPEHAGFGHPHAEVLRDFWTRRPIQVDNSADFSVLGSVSR